MKNSWKGSHKQKKLVSWHILDAETNEVLFSVNAKTPEDARIRGEQYAQGKSFTIENVHDKVFGKGN